MGGQYMYRAMSKLMGKAVAVQISKSKNEPDVMVEHLLDARDLSLLLTIAFRQRDPGKGYTDENSICYADPKTLRCISHIEKQSYYNARNFLINSGIVTFDEEKVCTDVDCPDKQSSYDNVYQIQWPRVMQLAYEAPWLDVATEKFKNKYGSKEKRASGNKKGVQPAEKDVQPAEKVVQPADTNIKEKIKKNNSSTTTNNSSIKDSQLAEAYRQYIIGKYGLTSNEPNTNQRIDIEHLARATKGKAPDRIKEMIDGYGKKRKPPMNPDPKTDAWRMWMGGLVNKLKTISQRRKATPEDLAAFAAPEREVTPQEAARQDAAQAIEDGWEKLVNGLALDKLPPDELDKLKGEFHNVFGRYATAKVPVRVNNFVARIQRENGGSFEALRKQCPEEAERVSLLRGCLEKEGQ